MPLKSVLLVALLSMAGPTVAQNAAAPALGAGAQREVLQACRLDLGAYCSGVQPGGGRIGVCIRDNWAKLTPACQKTITAVQGRRAGGLASSAQPQAAPCSAPAAPAGGEPPPDQSPSPASAPQAGGQTAFAGFLETCGSELKPLCGGIAYTDPEFGRCLRQNFLRLSQTCQSKLRRLPRAAGR